MPVQSGGKRSSDVSADPIETPSPASLEADLGHYKELFSKLRFSYLEQVTKEKFLRAIVGDPPLIVDYQENVELEQQLVKTKVELKTQKEEVRLLVAALESRGRELSRRHETIQLQTSQLESLPSDIANLETTLQVLRETLSPSTTDESLNLPLPATLSLLSERNTELAELNAQLKTLEHALPRKTRELERLESELKPLEFQKQGVTSAAKDARRRKEEALNGQGDDLEARGRWWRGVEAGLRGMLEVES
ncbi:hypothetical protein MMC16_005203 [Acarospora aff. strigata]|nr:hypothetical protein [Acarospora aff. strigata]